MEIFHSHDNLFYTYWKLSRLSLFINGWLSTELSSWSWGCDQARTQSVLSGLKHSSSKKSTKFLTTPGLAWDLIRDEVEAPLFPAPNLLKYVYRVQLSLSLVVSPSHRIYKSKSFRSPFMLEWNLTKHIDCKYKLSNKFTWYNWHIRRTSTQLPCAAAWSDINVTHGKQLTICTKFQLGSHLVRRNCIAPWRNKAHIKTNENKYPTKYLWFLQPTQLDNQGQWWSNLQKNER